MWYTIGKVNVTKGSVVVVGSGTQWSQAKYGVMPGMIFIGPDGVLYEIQSVNSDTAITLTAGYKGVTASAQGYAVVTTYEGDITQFSARFSALLTYFQASRSDLMSWLTGSGEVSISKDDGTKLTVPTLNKINSDLPKLVQSSINTERFRMPGTGASPTWVHLGTVNGLVQTGDTLRIEVTGSAGYNGRSDQNGIATIVLRTGAGGGSGGATINVRGRAGMTIYQQSGISLPIMDAAFTEVAENRYEIYLKLGAYNNRSFYVLSFENIASAQRSWTHVGVAKEPPTPPNDMMLTFVKVWNDYATTVDANGFIKKASPIARLSGAPEKMFDDYLDGFTLSGCAAVNREAVGVSAERVSAGVYKVTGALGFAEEGWNIEVPQDVNGNRLCFVSTNTGKDGTIYVKVSKRRFDIDTAAIVAGEPMDIPAGRWIDLRLEMAEVELVIDPDDAAAEEPPAEPESEPGEQGKDSMVEKTEKP